MAHMVGVILLADESVAVIQGMDHVQIEKNGETIFDGTFDSLETQYPQYVGELLDREYLSKRVG